MNVVFLYSDFTMGFRIPYTGPQVATDCTNLKSARELLEVVVKKIDKECKADRVTGPIISQPSGVFTGGWCQKRC